MAKAEAIPGFTEGPWVLSPNGTHIRKTLHGYNICTLDESAPDVIREANARLIAAAPDLYAFVVEFLEWHEGPGRTDSPLAEDARRLLSRVEQPQ